MADNLTSGTSHSGTITLSKRSGTVVTLYTSGNYCQKNIDLTINAPTASPSFDGGGLNAKGASASFTNMTVSSTDSSGVAIATSGTAGRDAVLYNGAVDAWLNASDNDPVLAASPSENWNGTTYYATGVTLGNGKSFDITVPNGSGTITFHFAVDASGNVTVTEGSV